jgi:hypothetical protein
MSIKSHVLSVSSDRQNLLLKYYDGKDIFIEKMAYIENNRVESVITVPRNVLTKFLQMINESE